MNRPNKHHKRILLHHIPKEIDFVDYKKIFAEYQKIENPDQYSSIQLAGTYSYGYQFIGYLEESDEEYDNRVQETAIKNAEYQEKRKKTILALKKKKLDQLKKQVERLEAQLS